MQQHYVCQSAVRDRCINWADSLSPSRAGCWLSIAWDARTEAAQVPRQSALESEAGGRVAQVEVPAALQEELKAAMGKAAIPVPDSEDRWGKALDALKARTRGLLLCVDM